MGDVLCCSVESTPIKAARRNTRCAARKHKMMGQPVRVDSDLFGLSHM